MKRRIGLVGAIALGLGLITAGTAEAAPRAADTPQATDTIYAPQDFVEALSDTRATGHYEVEGTGLRIWTDGTPSSASTNKVAEYVATSTPLARVGEPSLDYTGTTGTTPPGFQLVVDFDGNGTRDGILVGERVYNGDWWVNGAAAGFVKAGAPVTGGGSGTQWHGTLDQWRANFPAANVVAFGFSLGSGVQGDGVLDAINFAGTRYTFAETVTLESKNECKNGGWATSTDPVFRNQGECVSSFARTKD
ncbi:hypothetical protein [Blastococcus sp. URHD0036]|uniref:hypothetical protein n=1 Tax=Blastococcus sp. URHD0036 TaxID=1380356 RepID=UPI0004974790|nr:hypothetical protein [Blastococcus sp. URHD0036]